MRKPLGLLLALPLAACAGAGRAPLPPPSAAALSPPPVAAPAAAPVALAGLEGLLELGGTATTLHYSPGSLDRAAHLQQRLESLALVLSQLSRRPRPLEAWVLDREAWEKAGLERPYGLPERAGAAAFAVSSWGDAESVTAIEALLGGPVPPLSGSPLRGTAVEGGALVVADAILQVEVAQDFAATAGLDGDSPWVSGLLAQLVARVAFERLEPGRMPEIAALFDACAAAHGGPRAFRLEDYRDGLPLERGLWYEAQLLRGADVVWVKEGERGAARWLRNRLERRETLTAAELERLYPGLADWRAASFAP